MERPTAQQFEAIQAVFLEACELPAIEQTACVRKRLAGQAQLIDSVMRLLAADARGQGLGDPACVPAFSDGEGAAMQGHLPAGTLIGNWRIERLLAHGGMSAVYLASRQTSSFRQQVALKIIAADADPQRFTAERRILAGLEHPGIARLIDGGVHADGRPWLATEYIEGVRIDRFSGYAQEQAQAADRSCRGRSVRTRASGDSPRHQTGQRTGYPGWPCQAAGFRHCQIDRVRCHSRHPHRHLDHDTAACRAGTDSGPPGHRTNRCPCHGRACLRGTDWPHPFADEGTPIIAITRAIVDRQAPAPSSLCADMRRGGNCAAIWTPLSARPCASAPTSGIHRRPAWPGTCAGC